MWCDQLDDAKLMKVVKNIDDCRELQEDIDKIYEWSKRWNKEFNAKKCHGIELGKKRPECSYKVVTKK